MPVPVRYNLRSLFYRKLATSLTVIAVALTVGVLVILLTVQRGFLRAVGDSGRTDNLICMRDGATSEGESNLTRDDVAKLRALPEIARASDGTPLAAAEMYAAISLDKVAGGSTNVTLRGISPESFAVRDHVRLGAGAKPKPGSNEVLVGRALVGRVPGCQIGGVVAMGREEWPVVGILDSEGAVYDSEIWGDVELVTQVFDRPGYSTVIFRVAPGTDVGQPATFTGAFHERVQTAAATGTIAKIRERVGGVTAMTERKYFLSQTEFLGGTLTAMTVFLTSLMALGALAGCTNTLLASVAGRTREIGGLLAIGFRPRQIFLGFVLESMVLTGIGGLLGILLVVPINGITTGTTNWQTFTEQAFSLQLETGTIVTAMILALSIGLIGGAWPAWRASRLKPVDALRRG